MIQFACRYCGQLLVREDHVAGTVVICTCGGTNHVPLGGDALPEPRPEPLPAPPPATGPLVEMLSDVLPLEPSELPSLPPGDRCLNHPDRPKEQTCEACQEGFCPACVVRFQGQILCGACKNFRLRVLQRPSKVSGLAVASLVITFGLGVCGHCLVFAGAGARQPGVGMLGIVPQIVALILGIMAVREVETKPRTTGRALAMTGLLAAGVVFIELILLSLLVHQQLQ